MAVCHRDDPRLVAMAGTLRPYPWRRFRPELLARSLLAAKDRHELSCLLTGMPGTAVGTWNELQPADRDDRRAAVLVQFLASHRWTELGLTALCGHLLAVLGAGS